MNPIVGEFAVAEIPEPVPVVVDQIAVERLHRSGSDPKVPVQRGGRRFRLLEAQRLAELVVNAPRHIDVADYALVQRLDRAPEIAVRAPLGTALHQAVVLLGSRNHLAAFEKIVADRLFHVHVFPGLARPDGGQCVPVIARGDGHRVDTLVIQHAPQVLFEGRLLAGELLELRAALLQLGLVGIAKSGDLHTRDLGGQFQVIAAASAQPKDGDPDAVIGARPAAASDERSRGGGY